MLNKVKIPTSKNQNLGNLEMTKVPNMGKTSEVFQRALPGPLKKTQDAVQKAEKFLGTH